MKSSAQLKQDVIEELSWDPSCSANRIGVEVDDGVVTLSGHVDSFAEKWNAERAARRVAGVNTMAVEIKVDLPGSSKRNDSDIARTVSNVLEWASHIPKDNIKVMVEGGWITLTGEVEWEYQRNAAAYAVRYLMGVTGVSNEVTLRPSGSAQDITADIEAALKRLAKKEAADIVVHVEHGVVQLTGVAHSWGERELAEQTAWNAPGVKAIDNKINIAA